VTEQERADRFARHGLAFALSTVFLLFATLYLGYWILISVALNYD
jgi:uncharacterized membrane protein YccC